MTALLAATATVDRPTLWLVLAGLAALAALAYAASCAWWPFAACGKCEGAGKFRRSDSKVWRKCRRCKGTGERLRWGRKLYNRTRAGRRASAKR